MSTEDNKDVLFQKRLQEDERFRKAYESQQFGEEARHFSDREESPA